MSHELEDVWPLSPLQEGLVYHALLDGEGPDVYAVQLILDFEGAVDAGALRAAGQALLDRHANLRAAFWIDDLDQPVQVVARDVELPLGRARPLPSARRGSRSRTAGVRRRRAGPAVRPRTPAAAAHGADQAPRR
ncbi:condensation domain-containing protein [Streptomyces thioluteus]|uniref:condensation domain-containing protein n=1 Tax=Streptomyces thioluteus TaxID=66431 RepID=UPI003CD090C4